MSLLECPHCAAEWTGRKRSSHASGNWPDVSAPLSRPRTNTRTGPLARAVALDPYHWSGVVGNNTTLLVALAAVGSAFACLLVVVIVMVLRNRQTARATDPALGLRTPLYGE